MGGVGVSAEIVISSFGYLYGAPPVDTALVLDVREMLRDEDLDPMLAALGVVDRAMRDYVAGAPPEVELLRRFADAIDTLAIVGRLNGRQVTVAIGSGRGRNWPVVLVNLLRDVLMARDWRVETDHRDLARAQPIWDDEPGTE
jgi:RNase adaptor protein for sRNA GlmZ degradation